MKGYLELLLGTALLAAVILKIKEGPDFKYYECCSQEDKEICINIKSEEEIEDLHAEFNGVDALLTCGKRTRNVE